MDIRSWVEGHPKGLRNKAISGLADACGVTPAAVRHWVAGLRVPRSDAALKAVTYTGGQITLAGIYARGSIRAEAA